MKRLLLCGSIGAGLLLGTLATTFVPTPASAYYYRHHYYPYRHNGHYYRYHHGGHYYNHRGYRNGQRYWWN